MGLLDASLTTDYRVWDLTEPITYYHVRRGAGGTAPDVEQIAVAKRRPINKKELAKSAGAYSGLDRVWLIPAPLIVGEACKPGDQLQSKVTNAPLYTVLEADLNRHGNTWRLTTRDPIIAYNLRDTMNVETPMNLGQRGPAGAQAVKQWVTKYSAVVCRMQPEESQVADQRGQRGMVKRYICYLATPIDVTNEDRIAFGGVYYDITAVRNQESISDLMEIDCEKRPGA